jgi:MoxR-like ATPase
MRRDPWPVSGSVTEEKVNALVAEAVSAEHAAGSLNRLAAVEAVRLATLELCAQECDAHLFAYGAAKSIRAKAALKLSGPLRPPTQSPSR